MMERALSLEGSKGLTYSEVRQKSWHPDGPNGPMALLFGRMGTEAPLGK